MANKTSIKSTKGARKAAARRVAAKPALLAGGNPQIAKGYGDAPVQAYIAAMPGWKRDVGRRLDAPPAVFSPSWSYRSDVFARPPVFDRRAGGVPVCLDEALHRHKEMLAALADLPLR